MVILFKCRNHFRRVIELHISHSSCLKFIAIWLLQNYEWFEKEALLSYAITFVITMYTMYLAMLKLLGLALRINL